MKRCTSLLAALLVTVGLSTAQAQLHWDRSDGVIGGGPGGLANDGFWNLTDANWNVNADGSGSNTTWTDGSAAVFSAGNNVSGDPVVDSVVTLQAALLPTSVLIEEGHIWWTGSGSVNTNGAGNITLNPGTRLSLDSSLRVINTTPKIALGDGAQLWSVNTGNAGSLIPANTQIEIDGNGVGIIGYHDQNATPDNQVSIYSGVILGTGGTTTNGGRGTLIKRGPDQIGIGSTTQSGQHNQALFTFAKLRVEEGTYRLRNQTFDATVKETAFGAVPLAELPDAITLDSGGIGTNTTVTLHAFRGITVTANDGFLDHGATAGLNIPGPLTAAAADHVLNIGSPTSTATNNVTFALSHPNNVNTFQGSINGRRGVLRLDSSLNAANFSGTGMGGANVATVQVQTGQTFTFGSGGANTTYDGILAGAGTFRKVGNGTTTFNGTNANTHSGDTRIEDGTLSITQPYLANGGDVYLSTGSILDLSFVATDVIDSLFFDGVSQTTGTWGALGSGATNESSFFTGTGLLSVTTFVNPVTNDADFNDDGTIDAADYTAWRKFNPLATGASQTTGDADGDGDNDDTDLAEWVENFGGASPGAGGGGAVPEPSTVAMLLIGLAAFAARRRS